MKIIYLVIGAFLFGCVAKTDRRSPSQIEGAAAGAAVWDEDIVLKQKQLAEEDKVRREQPRTDAFRAKNFKTGFQIVLKVIGNQSWGPEIFSYQRECFVRMVEEFLDYQPNPKVLTEEAVRNVTVSELKGWSNTRNFFTFEILDDNNQTYKGHMYVSSGTKKDPQNNDYYFCAAVPGKGYDMIELRSSSGLIFSSTCVTDKSSAKCSEIK